MQTAVSRFTGGDGRAKTLARGLGWFSIALGTVELLTPRWLSEAAGIDQRRSLVQAYGLREMAAGLGILSSSDQRPWIWSRIAGDAVDLATLAPALSRRNPSRAAACAAFGAVAAVTLLDIACARQLQRERARVPRHLRQPASPPRDYSHRSGFPRPPDAMRGKARHLLARSDQPASARATSGTGAKQPF